MAIASAVRSRAGGVVVLATPKGERKDAPLDHRRRDCRYGWEGGGRSSARRSHVSTRGCERAARGGVQDNGRRALMLARHLEGGWRSRRAADGTVASRTRR